MPKNINKNLFRALAICAFFNSFVFCNGKEGLVGIPGPLSSQSSNIPFTGAEKIASSESAKKDEVAQAAKNASSASIVFYTTGPYSGGVSLIGDDVLWGITLVVNKANASGIFSGRSLSLEAKDNCYDSVLAADQLSDPSLNSKILICPFGPRIGDKLIDLSTKKSINVYFPISGQANLYSSQTEKVFHFRPSLKAEILALVEYASVVQKCQNLAIFHEDSSWGLEALGYAKEALGARAIATRGIADYAEGTVEVMNAVTEISKQQPAAVLIIAQARAAYNFISQGLRKGLKNCKFFGLGEVVPNQDILLKARGIGLFTSSAVPSPFNSDYPIAAQYRADMAKFYANKAMSQYFFESYVVTQIIIDCLKKIKDDWTPEKIGNIVSSFKNYNFGGFVLNFDSRTRRIHNKVWINTGTKGVWPAYSFD